MDTERRHSRKREALRAELLRCRDHPSAEMLYGRMKKDFPDLSLGTVYRNLSLFRQNGEAVCVATVRGEERFDAVTAPHAHFICDSCGAVLDVEQPLPETLLTVHLPGRVREYSLTFYGICARCIERGNTSEQ